ncbi:MAG: thioredoxin-like domain-containing protein [Bacteroidota bacterium]
MKLLFFVALTILTTSSFAQKLKFKVIGQKDTTVHLVKYFGGKLFWADTAEIKDGYVEFDGAKQKAGVMALLLPGQKFFEFIHNNEEVMMETTGPDFVANMKVKKSEENRIFIDYIRYIQSNKTEAAALIEKRSKLDKESAEYKTLGEQIDAVNKKVVDYQKNLIKTHEGKLIAKIAYMSMEIEIPEAPKDSKGNVVDSNFKFNYFRAHYWDHVDFKDDRLVNSPIFANKLDYYFGKNMMVQHWDTVIKYAFDLCDRLPLKSRTFEYCVGWITSEYGKSKIMGMDKVYVMMADRYYCNKSDSGISPAFWMTEDKLADLCEKIPVQKNLVMGVKPPNLILRDTSDVKWQDFYSLKSEYTILYFWDPECGHCKTITPKLNRLYTEKLKARNVEVFAVGKAVGEEFKKWKDYVRTNDLKFINVAVTDPLFKAAMEDARQFVPKYTTIESLNYQTTYDIFSTPRVFLLDKDKKIVAKSLSLSQLEEFIDRLQGHEKDVKLFPPDPEDDEQMH